MIVNGVKFQKKTSTVPPIPTKRTPTCHLNHLRYADVYSAGFR